MSNVTSLPSTVDDSRNINNKNNNNKKRSAKLRCGIGAAAAPFKPGNISYLPCWISGIAATTIKSTAVVIVVGSMFLPSYYFVFGLIFAIFGFQPYTICAACHNAAFSAATFVPNDLQQARVSNCATSACNIFKHIYVADCCCVT